MAFQVKPQVKHTDAKWFEAGDSKILITSIDNPDYQVAHARFIRLIMRNDTKFKEGQPGALSGEKTEFQSLCYLYANFLIKDWEGVLDENGNPLPFTKENAERLMQDSLEAFVFVQKSAEEYSADLRGELEEAVGKPSPDSSGKETGVEAPKGTKKTPKSTAS